MELTMRWMKKKDIVTVLKIQEESQHNKKFFDSIVSARRNPSFGFDGFNSFVSYVCEFDKKVIGYIVYKVSLLDFSKDIHSKKMLKHKNKFPMSGEIVSFSVLPEYRLNGVGTFIVESVLNRFSSVIELSLKDFCPRPFILYATCSERNLGSHLFFKRLGFLGRKIFWNAFGEGHDGYLMVYESVQNKSAFACEKSVK